MEDEATTLVDHQVGGGQAERIVLRRQAAQVDRIGAGRLTGGAGQRINSPDSPAYGALRAIDPVTGDRKWEFKYLTPSTAGLLTTASGLVFTGDADGNLIALDSTISVNS